MAEVRVAPSTIEGQGVFAAQDMKLGHVILQIDDSRVVTGDNPLRPEDGELERHCDYPDGKVILMQPPERYINHSCDPNSFVRAVLGTRYVFARRDIAAGEEITYDYCVDGEGDTVWTCNCGSDRCRHTIHSDFFHLPLDLQLEYLPLLSDWHAARYEGKVRALIKEALS